MVSKRVAPGAIVAMKEALALIYWYKPDLRQFLEHSCNRPGLIAALDWSTYKRNIAGRIVDLLDPDELVSLMQDVASFDDFSHLTKLEDGDRKAEAAQGAVAALRVFIVPHAQLVEDQKRAEEMRELHFKQLKQSEAVQQKLEQMRLDFIAMAASTDLTEQAKGYKLEGVLTDVFDLFDLDAKSPFRVEGEQIDGSFSLEGTDYILEARWRKKLTDFTQLDAFKGKIDRRLENTLGLFLSINGFEPTAINKHSGTGAPMILMEGRDLYGVLEGRIDLQQLLLRKRRHASQTGNVYLPIEEVL